MNLEYDYLFKLVLIGDSYVGKQCLLSRFSNNTYIGNNTGCSAGFVEFKFRKVNLDGKIIKLEIWHTAGDERFRTITGQVCRDAHGVFIVYDVTVYESFHNVKQWLQEIDRYCYTSNNMNKLIVGNKCDLTTKKEVCYANGKEYADSLNIPFFETSAKDSTNVEEAFMTLVANVKYRMVQVPLDPPNKLIQTPNVNRNRVFHWTSRIFKSGLGISDSMSTSQCADCQNPPHIQCMHCSKCVCMDCAQKHVALATDQGNNMKRVPDDKMIILDHLSTETKTRVDAEHNTIMAQAYAQIDQLIEEYKKQIREISVELNHLPLNQISSFAERMTTEIEYINEGNS